MFVPSNRSFFHFASHSLTHLPTEPHPTLTRESSLSFQSTSILPTGRGPFTRLFSDPLTPTPTPTSHRLDTSAARIFLADVLAPPVLSPTLSPRPPLARPLFSLPSLLDIPNPLVSPVPNMRLSSQALWSLAALLSCLHIATAVDAAAAAGVLQVDLIFPQDGEVYAPTPDMPFVFALQNAGLAKYTYPNIYMSVMNRSDPELRTHDFQYEYTDLNWTSNDPYFPYYFFDQFATEGNWSVGIQFWWGTCLTFLDGRFRGRMDSNFSSDTAPSISFTIRKGGKAVDIAKALANDKPCAGDAITVGDEVYTASDPPAWAPSGKCVVANHTTHSACPASIGPAVLANISAGITQRVCGRADPPASCPPPPSKSAAQRLDAAVAGSALLATAIGVLGFVEVLT